MIIVTTLLYPDEDQGMTETQPGTYWRAGCALIDFGNLLVSSAGERYPSQEAAWAEIGRLALRTIREWGR